MSFDGSLQLSESGMDWESTASTEELLEATTPCVADRWYKSRTVFRIDGGTLELDPDVRFLSILCGALSRRGIAMSFIQEALISLGLTDFEQNIKNYIEHYCPNKLQ